MMHYSHAFSVYKIVNKMCSPLLFLFAYRYPSPRPSSTNMLTECCDVMLAHSPPIYSGPPQDLSVLYKNWLVVNQKQQSPLSVRRSASFSPTRSDDRQPTVAHLSPSSSKPRRPCLVIRTDSDGSIGSSSSSSSDETEPSSPVRRKKKVVFADDRGLSLTQVSDTHSLDNIIIVKYLHI